MPYGVTSCHFVFTKPPHVRYGVPVSAIQENASGRLSQWVRGLRPPVYEEDHIGHILMAHEFESRLEQFHFPPQNPEDADSPNVASHHVHVQKMGSKQHISFRFHSLWVSRASFSSGIRLALLPFLHSCHSIERGECSVLWWMFNGILCWL